MAEIDITDENLRNLEAVQRVISAEEGREANIEEALSRVLTLYRKLVPYN